MGRTMILMNQRWYMDKFYMKTVKRVNIDIFSVYKVYKGIMWKIAALYMQKLKLPFQSIWYGKWKKSIKQYDTVIIFNCNLNWSIIRYFKKINPDIRIIAWYWDALQKEQIIPDKYKSMCEIWSFDINDCLQFGWNKNVQFYCLSSNIREQKIKYDAVLVAKDKGRFMQIMEIAGQLKNAGKNVYLRIVPDKTSKNKKCTAYGKPLLYEELLDIISQSNSVIEIIKEGQSGLTERVLESLFLHKKLITTNKAIVDEPFYNPANIMIWNNPSQQEIQDFFLKPYEPIAKEVINKFTFDAWIKNFGIND